VLTLIAQAFNYAGASRCTASRSDVRPSHHYV